MRWRTRESDLTTTSPFASEWDDHAKKLNEVIAALEAPKNQLRDTSALVQAAREAFGRYTPGTCRWLSLGDGCDCLKCVADALVLVTAQRDALQQEWDGRARQSDPQAKETK